MAHMSMNPIARASSRNESRRATPQNQIDRGSKSKSSRHFATCREEVGFIDDYLSGELSGTSRSAFENHLKICPDCVAFMATYKKTIEITRSFLRLAPLPQQPRKLTLRQPQAT